MSKFVVSARKYRPVRFDDVVGQEHVSQTLKNAIQNDQLAHAFLFCGPRGVGKTTCARILAKVLNCQNITKDYEACNTCESCRAFNQNASFNITELDAASNNSVEHIRSLIEQVRFQPQQGQYKVFIIDEVHMLSQQAFNAFLKTLEEPPPYAIFILATTEKHKIIPTILSRCQIFDFRRIQVQDMVVHLNNICKQEGIQAEREALHIIAQKADGALRDALSIFDRIVSSTGKQLRYEDVIANLNVLDYDHYFRIIDSFLIEEVGSVLLGFNEVLKKGFEPDIFINGLAEHLRNLLVSQDADTLPLLEVSEGLKGRYQKQADKAPTSFLLSALQIANECDVHFKMARNRRLHAEMALIKMCYINRAVRVHQTAPTEPSHTSAGEKKTADHSGDPGREPASPESKVNESPSGHDSEVTLSSNPPQHNDATDLAGDKALRSVKSSRSKLNKSTKFKTVKIAKLDELEEAVKRNDVTEESEDSFLTDEALQSAWEDYSRTVSSNSVKAMLKQAGKKLEAEHRKLTITVASQMAKGQLQQETDLMPFLRKRLRTKILALDIQIDSSKALASTGKKRPKPLSAREKYEKLNENNPLLKEMRKRFDLKIDKD